jgi:hypothetical protein
MPSQWRVGTYCLGTARYSKVRLALRVTAHPCDGIYIGRGSPCDPTYVPTCPPDVGSIKLPRLAPLNAIYRNATCLELKTLLYYLGVDCSTNIGQVVPEIGGDGTLNSLCPVTCGLCPVEVVDPVDYSVDPMTCNTQDDTCLVEWKHPLEPDKDYCKLKRRTRFNAGHLSCSVRNKCVCSPTSCEQEHRNCGAVPDRCGGVLACGACSEEDNLACYDNVCGEYRPEPEPEPEPEPTDAACAANSRIFEYVATGKGADSLSWEEAAQAAVTYADERAEVGSQGMVRGFGYLATLNSREEQGCIESLTEERGWLGGSRSGSGNVRARPGRLSALSVP